MKKKITIGKVVLFVVLVTLAVQWKAFKNGVVDGWNEAMAATKQWCLSAAENTSYRQKLSDWYNYILNASATIQLTFSFEILHVSNFHNRGQFIFARLLDEGLDFEIKDGAMFGGMLIYNYVDMPRMLDDNNQPRLDVFVFKPLTLMQEGDFIYSQRVELTMPSN